MIVHEGLSNPADIAAPRASRAGYPWRFPLEVIVGKARKLDEIRRLAA
jgi:hypothetical protein